MLPVNYDLQQRINRTFSIEAFMEKSLVEKIVAVFKSTLFVLSVLIMLCGIVLLVLSHSNNSKNMESFGQPKNPETYEASTARIAEIYRWSITFPGYSLADVRAASNDAEGEYTDALNDLFGHSISYLLYSTTIAADEKNGVVVTYDVDPSLESTLSHPIFANTLVRHIEKQPGLSQLLKTEKRLDSIVRVIKF